MFSSKPRPRDDGEIISPIELITWQEDASVTERRRRVRNRQIWTTGIGVAIAIFVLGNAFGISWLFSAVANIETTSAQLK
jgi:hypothetical protein